MSKIKAILCDFDGVLSESCEDTFLSWQFALSQFDISISKEEYFLEEGKSSEEIALSILSATNSDSKLAPQIIEIKNAHYQEHGEYRFYPGTEELISWAKISDIKFCIVSGGSKQRLEHPKNQPITSQADLIITAADVTLKKPHPEPYLSAIKKLGLKREECVILENAPLGIQSACAAEIRCIAIASTLSSKYLLKAQKVVNNLLEAIEELKKWQTNQ